MKKMKLWAGAAVLLLLIGVLAACGGAGEEDGGSADGGSYNKLTAEEAYDRINSGDHVAVVDVRTKEEYEKSHIEGALMIPSETIGEEPPAQLPDKDAEILIYSKSGEDSQQAAEKLIGLGYTNVFDFGGIKDWPYETVSGPAADDSSAEAGAGQAEGSQGGEGQTGDAAGTADGSGQAGTASPNKQDPEESADPSFSNFKAEDVNGNAVDESIFADYDLTMVNIWGTFCGPCIREMPELGEINREYEGKGFQIVGIVTDVLNQDLSVSKEQLETAQEIIEKTGADYLHLIPSEDLLYAGVASVRTIPFTFFVDKDGNLTGDVYSGSKTKDKWEKIIRETLEEVRKAAN